ncbi:hypothetical protein RRG08_058416 [Elysia crispata]|uniref:Uncharacterized protein n=1 Tax=Elysia crispata TaxID=231223 RepID=A0AAE1CNB4_9GAST|nr:hypothetical protein RRG08_058416 [Elysia crispata]
MPQENRGQGCCLSSVFLSLEKRMVALTMPQENRGQSCCLSSVSFRNAWLLLPCLKRTEDRAVRTEDRAVVCLQFPLETHGCSYHASREQRTGLLFVFSFLEKRMAALTMPQENRGQGCCLSSVSLRNAWLLLPCLKRTEDRAVVCLQFP